MHPTSPMCQGECTRARLYYSVDERRCELSIERKGNGCVPALHELHDFVFVEHHPPRGRLAAGQQHPPLGPRPVLASACSATQYAVRANAGAGRSSRSRLWRRLRSCTHSAACLYV